MSTQKILGFFFIFLAALIWLNILPIPLSTVGGYSTNPSLQVSGFPTSATVGVEYDWTVTIANRGDSGPCLLGVNTLNGPAAVVLIFQGVEYRVGVNPNEGSFVSLWADNIESGASKTLSGKVKFTASGSYTFQFLGVGFINDPSRYFGDYPVVTDKKYLQVSAVGGLQPTPQTPTAVVYDDQGVLTSDSKRFINKLTWSVMVNVSDPGGVVSAVYVDVFKGGEKASRVQATKTFETAATKLYSAQVSFPGDGTYVVNVVVSTSSASYTVLTMVSNVSTVSFPIKANQLLSLALALIGLVLVVKGGRE